MARLNVFKLKHVMQMFDGLGVGDRVEIEWPVPPSYGDKPRRVKGTIVKMDEWITIATDNGTSAYLPLTLISSVRAV